MILTERGTFVSKFNISRVSNGNDLPLSAKVLVYDEYNICIQISNQDGE